MVRIQPRPIRYYQSHKHPHQSVAHRASRNTKSFACLVRSSLLNFSSEGREVMQTVFIKFLTHEDRVRGFYELATRARIGSFPGEVYQVPLSGLCQLDDQRIGYRRATDAEVKAAHAQVRNPTPALL